MSCFYQKTIKNNIQFKGVGLHSGKQVIMNILPAAPNHGIVFKRTDLKNKNLIPATFDKVGVYLRRPCFSPGQLCVTLSRARCYDDIKIQVFDTSLQGLCNGEVFTPNVVYHQVLC